MPLEQSQSKHSRVLIESLDQEFGRLYSSWRSLIDCCGDANLYAPATSESAGHLLPAIGVSILRSAAVVEQTCGGITSNLWDDPFEWTLPETLTTRQSILDYLAEVEALRKKAFSSIVDDAELIKEIAAPSGELVTLVRLLLQTLARASQLYGQALVTAKITFPRESFSV
jgi:hypothetical protein